MSVTGQTHPRGQVEEYRLKLTPDLKQYLSRLRGKTNLILREIADPENRGLYRKERIAWSRLRCSEAKQCIDQDGNIMDLVILVGAAEPVNNLKANIATELQDLGYAYHNYLMIEVEWEEST